MKARMESLEMLANNIANQSSAGYKADREFYSLYSAPEASPGGVVDPPLLPVIEKHWTDFSQGTLNETGDPLHLAIDGKGFFTVSTAGGTLYTRNGNFHFGEGGQLSTQEGFAVLDAGGKAVLLNTQQPVEFTNSGQIKQAGVVVGQLGLVEFGQPETLAKHSGTYFQMNETGEKPTASTRASLHQGKLEVANYSPAESAVRLVSLLRQFEMLQKAIQIGSEMGRRADEVARVGS